MRTQLDSVIDYGQFRIVLNEKNGAIVSINAFQREFIHSDGVSIELFILRMLDAKGNPLDLASSASHRFSMERLEGSDAGTGRIRMRFERLDGLDIHAMVEVTESEGLAQWWIAIENKTDLILEWIDFPEIIVPNDLVGNGGDARIIWPHAEGVLIEDADIRERTWLNYKEPGYPSKGYEGIYPGPASTQFMAYYGKQGGIYIGAHDENGNIKSIEYRKYEGGIKLQFRLFAGGAGRGTFRPGYPMVIGVFQGDWQNAADIYRRWFDQSNVRKPAKVVNNKSIPDWYHESPVVITYPVRGEIDRDQMLPNEYFPYTNAIPYLEHLANSFDSKIMALLMHWEGTAPWAPPYVWPPFGGAESLKLFAEQLHQKGHLLGLYCSGIGWTQESLIVPEYQGKEQYERDHLADIMCVAPDGSLPYSLICGGAQRWGYDMCPENPIVEKIVFEEVRNILGSDCDYIQFFDQNLGGMSYFCYSHTHGHGAGPGRWQTEAMSSLYRKLQELVVNVAERKVLIGCESAAAEPFISELLFNDLRFNVNYFMGEPIPLYQYIYHEYVNNFMGNQNTASHTIDFEASSNNLLWRMAYSFISGDMLTVVLSGNGTINWDWNSEWTGSKPDQEQTAHFIRNINSWRTGVGKPYLCYGKMLKPHKVVCEEGFIQMKAGHQLIQPSVLTSCWEGPDGTQAQFVVNYTGQEQQIDILLNGIETSQVRVYETADGNRLRKDAVSDNGNLRLRISPLSAVMIQL